MAVQSHLGHEKVWPLHPKGFETRIDSPKARNTVLSKLYRSILFFDTSSDIQVRKDRTFSDEIILKLVALHQHIINRTKSAKPTENERKIGGIHKYEVRKTAKWACTMEDGVPCLSFSAQIPLIWGGQFPPKSAFCLAGRSDKMTDLRFWQRGKKMMH